MLPINKIKKLIDERGHIDVSDMMEIALTSDKSSYYNSAFPFGPKGDFITAPETSQMFGEMIGVWCADLWQKHGSPAQFNIVELGGGSGALMKDLLRATRHIQGFHDSLSITMIEVSEKLSFIQREALHKSGGSNVSWQKDLSILPSGFTIFIANEFFDALPIRQFILEKDKWLERVISYNSSLKLHFSKRVIPDDLQAYLQANYKQAKDGAILEESRQAVSYIQEIVEHIKKHGGSALIIDYGYDIEPSEREASQYDSTLQAISHHKYAPILSSLGVADLSAHVNFDILQKAVKARGVEPLPIITQAQFLLNCGIDYRFQSLISKAPKDIAEILAKQYHRLISSDQMGELFKVMILKP